MIPQLLIQLGMLVSCSSHNTLLKEKDYKGQSWGGGSLRPVAKRREWRREVGGEPLSLRAMNASKVWGLDRGRGRWMKGEGISITIKGFLRNCKGVDDTRVFLPRWTTRTCLQFSSLRTTCRKFHKCCTQNKRLFLGQMDYWLETVGLCAANRWQLQLLW